MIYSDMSDDDLVNISLTGNNEAYELLVLRYQQAVVKSAYAVTCNWYMAEDAAQDAFVSAWIKLDTLREPSKYGAWVCRISRNRAKNIIMRYRDYIDYDEIAYNETESKAYLEEVLYSSDKNDKLYNCINSLTEKIRTVIKLHYIDGYSLGEIADMLRVQVGTVKWRLYEGREKIRKEFNILLGDELTLVEKVMQKVEELKLWQLKTDKSGFADDYNELMKDIESLPESEQKYHAMADTLMRGYWWLPGEKNDELIERLRDAAIKGNNQEVMEHIVYVESDKLSGIDRINFMRDKQVPYLEELGFTKALGRTWFWLGYYLFRNDERDAGFAAYDRALEILDPSEVYYANTIAAIKTEKESESYDDERSYYINPTGEQYKFVNGKLCFWSQPGYRIGRLKGLIHIDSFYYHSALCDDTFYDPDMNVGDVYTGSDGTSTLKFAENNVTIETDRGTFDGCELWITDTKRYNVRTYYKRSIGIVHCEILDYNLTVEITLNKYNINGGDGLIPFAVGNRWEYTVKGLSENQTRSFAYEVVSFDGTDAILQQITRHIKTGLDDTWQEMMLQVRNYYWKNDKDDQQYLVDVFEYMDRAEELAVTPFQKAHTKEANSVMRRIYDNRNNIQWNFFTYRVVKDDLSFYDDRTYSFEWKNTDENSHPLLLNDIYSIFEEAVGCIWSDKFVIGADFDVSKPMYDFNLETNIKVKDGGKINEFNDCLLISLDISGNCWVGWKYRTGKMDYYFAKGIGIVRSVTYYGDGKISTYDLTSYSGIGEGYMPIEDGFTRHYDAIGLKDGYVGAADYVYSKNDDGQMVILEDRTGIKIN